MSEAKFRRTIRDNLVFLAKNTALNSQALNALVQGHIITKSDQDELKRRRQNDGDYDMNSHFYQEILVKKDAGKYEKFYKLMEEEDTRQNDDVLAILKKGLERSTNSGNQLPEFDFNKTRSDGVSFPTIKWPSPKSNQKETVEFPKYKLTPNGARLAIVVNITAFQIANDRDGALHDSVAMATALYRLGFKVLEVKEFVTGSVLKDQIKQFKEICKEAEVCAVVVMSHGDRDVIFTSNGERININADILAQFNNTNFQEFAGKPKLFFFQACRGSNDDQGTVEGVGTMSDGPRMDLKIPSWTDMLVCYSTLEDHYSYRETSGSWFIQILAKKLVKYGSSIDICKILSLVAEEMKSVGGSEGQKQICPWTNIGFTKELYL